MNLFEKAWAAMNPKFLGGEVVSTYGTVRGEPAMGTTADLFKSSGELRVHLVRAKDDGPRVTLEWLQVQVPGDASELVCMRLSPSEAERLGSLLIQAAGAA